MLVRAFEVNVRRCRQAACFQHEGVGGAGFEPDVDDVLDLFVIGSVVIIAEKILRRAGVPGVRTLTCENLLDAA